VQVVLDPLVVLDAIIVSCSDPWVHRLTSGSVHLVANKGLRTNAKVEGKTFLPLNTLVDALDFIACLSSSSSEFVSDCFLRLFVPPNVQSFVKANQNVACRVVN
jgi:hypothetical protein